ncbi:hypothetical protein [Kribbella deserti]|uniref:Antibiotic biosynthesis monooxygenase n=1 Tax=Kribbella deserti TaxID=1926257 RepID=A0ABV6QK78_9ACTN
MTTAVVRYQTKPDQADENQRLIENVFAELAAKRPEVLRYQCVRLEDGVTFVHVVHDAEGSEALTSLKAFQEFQRGLKDRLADEPERTSGHLVGSYVSDAVLALGQPTA